MAGVNSPSLMTQVALAADDRPAYSKSQIHQYFERLNLPSKYLESPILSDPAFAKTKEHGLPFIQALTRYHACNVPFENLELHYSLHKKITLNENDLYDKIVSRRRGGRCMENNTFFGTVLRSLGFHVRNCAGRVARSMSPYPNVRQSQGSTYDGWNHMLNLVRLDNEWFLVDVGMGSMGPNIPVPLRNGQEMISIAPRKIRLQYRTIAETFVHPDTGEVDLPKLWCYDVCYHPSSASGSGEGSESVDDVWVPIYCFSTMEFLPQDYEMMSWYTSTNPRSFFTTMVTCTRLLMDDDGDNIVGALTLFEHDVSKNIGGKKEPVMDCKTEKERVDVLHDLFNVTLTEEERSNIPTDRRLA